MKIEKNDVIFFNGDSITDYGRNREDIHSLAGYTKIVADTFTGLFPDKGVSFFNRGISGDTSRMLSERLEGELKEIRPTVFSLLIGINDVWRHFDSGLVTTTEEFDNNIAQILKTVSRYTGRIVILEPFIIPQDKNKLCFYEKLWEKICVLRKYAAIYKAEYVPLDGIFNELSIKNGAELYSYDGIHLTETGNMILAAEFLKRCK